jgi:hypothetical protein
LAGVTAIETRRGCPTVKMTEPVMEPEVALMTALPIFIPVARPAALMLAMSGTVELHATALLISSVLPSEYFPRAVKLWPVPRGIVMPVGLRYSDSKTGGLTGRAVEPVIAPELALILAVPTAIARAKPVAPIVATEEASELHETELVISWVLASV